MEDSNYLAQDLSHDSFDSDSLSGLHTAWLDDEQLNNLPIVDVLADVSTLEAQNSDDGGLSTTQKVAAQSPAAESVLSAALGDHDTQLLDVALDFPFDTELSPILEPFAEATVAMSPMQMQRRQSKSPRGKWPPTSESEPVPPFSSLLLQRFDAISTKVRTKSVMEVRQFYTTVMQHISEMLEVVDNDIDLTNPDQVRIAVWCWKKLMADKNHHEEFQALGSQPASVKNRLANVLLQSIIRSRRQMLKAKSDHMYNSAPNSTDKPTAAGLTSISAWVSRSNLSSFFAKGSIPVPEVSTVQIHHPMVRKKHPAPQDQVALMPPASSPSVTENATQVLSVQQPIAGVPEGALRKRKRGASPMTEFPPEKKSRSSEIEAATFTSPPPTDKRSRSRPRDGVTFHTPQQFSRKKIYIKMRMVPRDKQTKSDVVSCGCRPKVELKLSSTKKISEITAHMTKKWAKVHSLLPKGAVLCFFQKNGTDNWSKDLDVTCFDIWKHCGKQTNGENVVDVSYVWQVPEQTVSPVDDENVQVQDLMPAAALFRQDVPAATKPILISGDESEMEQLSPAHGLQEYGAQVAFDRSVTAKAKEEAAALAELTTDSGDEGLGEEFSPTTGRLRRRIQPVLVSKEEFDI
uniref:Uncharacterized protein n=1 Tax=Phytophthora ramorum TaxID=164328 RepID=H3GH84_PHYRM